MPKEKKKLYTKCKKCDGHSYLTIGGFYLCVKCGHRDYDNLKRETEKLVQLNLKK